MTLPKRLPIDTSQLQGLKEDRLQPKTASKTFLLCMPAIVLLTITSLVGSASMVWAALAYGVMWAGFLMRQHLKIHYVLMLTAIAMDLGLVLFLQVTRDAVDTALSFSLSPWQQLHIAASFLAVAFYIPTIFFGLNRLFGNRSTRYRRAHILCAMVAFVTRTIGFILMYSMVGRSA